MNNNSTALAEKVKGLDAKKIGNALLNNALIIIMLAVAVYVAVTEPSFLAPRSLVNLLSLTAAYLPVALGIAGCIVLTGTDLSAGRAVGITACVAASLLQAADAPNKMWPAIGTLPVPVVILIVVLLGAAIGAFNGFFVAKFKLHPFIVTLATMNIARGLAGVYTGGSPVRVVSKEWQFLGAGYIANIPVPVIIMAVVFIISILIVNRTKMGRYIYAVGGNVQAAKFSGIKVEKVKFFVYTYTGLLAGLAGIILASRMYSGQPTAGEGAEMDAIAAVVVGGTSMAGGSGKLGGTLIGALIIGILNNGLNLMNVNSFWQTVVKGVVILLAVFLDYIRNIKKND